MNMSTTFLCTRCSRMQLRRISQTTLVRKSEANQESPAARQDEAPEGRLSQRLQDATEEALLTGGRAGRRIVLEDAGFSKELKDRLLEKLADAQFKSEHAATLSEAGLTTPRSAGRGTREAAAAQPWTGQEDVADTVLRMLDGARKPLRPELRGQPAIPGPVPVDLRPRREGPASAGQKAASARDKAAAYAGMNMKNEGMSEQEREAFRKELRDRFRPGARAMPNTITGLAALANERIEDAIARGQFKNLPRGKERDTRADNPFVDTTEYIMNKMIQRQEIVPPWIEKQQELVKAANMFRFRLRSDWRRHAARTIASRFATLEEQMKRAREYARAEELHNPRTKNPEQMSVPTNATEDVVMVKLLQTQGDKPSTPSPEDRTTSDELQISAARPFRDPDWEQAEKAYLELNIANLNALCRSYNLMAPELAKKPYFSLKRELNRCFADVAPELAETIKQRATRPAKSMMETVENRSSGVWRKVMGEGHQATIYESTAPHYGLREMWREFWANVRR